MPKQELFFPLVVGLRKRVFVKLGFRDSGREFRELLVCLTNV